MNIHSAGVALGWGTPGGRRSRGSGRRGRHGGDWVRRSRATPATSLAFEEGRAGRMGEIAAPYPPRTEPTNQNSSYKLPSCAVSFFLFISFHLGCFAKYLVGDLGLETARPHSADAAALPTSQASTQVFLATSLGSLSLSIILVSFFVSPLTVPCHGKFLLRKLLAGKTGLGTVKGACAL